MATSVDRRARSSVFKLLLAPARWLERTRGRRRLALFAIYSLIVIAIGVLLWRQSRLVGLPDIGDPFDPAPLYALRLPDHRNAFVLFARANAAARRDTKIEQRLLTAPYAWPPPTDQEGLAYLSANAEALALWREGSERPDALYIPIRELSYETPLPLLQEHRHFFRLALLEASRHEQAGDMAGAWDWYRVILRSSRLVGRHTHIIGWLVGSAEYAVCQPRIVSWAADPRVDVNLLKRALDDVQTLNAMTSRASECLKIDYLSGAKFINDTDRFLKLFYNDPWNSNDKTLKVWYYHLPGYWQTRWFLENEPEASRRYLRLVYANWLSQCDVAGSERAPLLRLKGADCKLFDVRPPRGAMPVKSMIARVNSLFLAQTVLMPYDVTPFDRDLSIRAGLVMSLADKLYERKYGKPAATVDALIGTCLDRFPDGYVKPQEFESSATAEGR